MTMSRRSFFGSTAAIGAAAAAADLVAGQASGRIPRTAAAGSTPSPTITALNRMGFGPRPPQSPAVQNPATFPGDVALVDQIGLEAYIDQQLNPAAIDDSFCDAQLAAVRMRLEYNAGTGYAARNELVPLDLLGATTQQLWSRADFGLAMDWQERMWPWYQVRTATLVRAAYSERQLLEVLVDFWHNHFNVHASGDVVHSVAFPEYDRIMRQHCLGNFRQFVEAVAQSTAMMYMLDNYSNRAGGGEAGNENYARELFELHTLGSDNYLKFYDDRNQIGTVSYNGEQFARGYIDKDVYEAASCLTGWSVRNGDWRLPAGTADDGTFIYVAGWHDGGAKIVLNTIIDNNQSQDMKDGRDVLDLVCRHIGTARHLCFKLARRLIGDNPPYDVVEAAVAEWMASRDAPDQIRRAVAVILRSQAFGSGLGQKVKRPFEFLASYIRATGMQLRLVDDSDPDGSNWSNILNNLANTGHRLFEWPTPTGHPDLASYWLSTNGMLRRWNLPFMLLATGRWNGNAQLDVLGLTPAGLTCRQIVDFWAQRVLGYSPASTTSDALVAFLAQDKSPDSPPSLLSGETSLRERLESMLHLLAMSPEFQSR
jgi:uncharacterized protein (DUF1800 family)